MKIITKLKSILLATFAVVLCGASFAAPANAEQSMALSITPTMEKISLIPGKSYSSSIKVTNPSDEKAMPYKAYVTPFSIVNDDYDKPNFSTKGAQNDLTDWITIDEDTVKGSVEPRQSVNINFTIEVPQNANPGGQYAAIAVNYDSEDAETKGNIGVKSQYNLMYAIYGTVAGDFQESGNIKENNINTFFLDSKIGGTSIVENTGNVHADATYILRVFPLFSGEEIYSNEEKPTTYTIMPGTSRFIATSWSESPSIGIFTAEQEIKFLDKDVTTSKLVVVMPIWLLLAIVFVIVFWVIWLVMRNKNRKANKGKSAGKSSKPSSTSSTTPSRPAPSDKPESKPDTTE